MTRELIEDFAKIVKPFVQKRLLESLSIGMNPREINNAIPTNNTNQ